jgi:hypothetical protein
VSNLETQMKPRCPYCGSESHAMAILGQPLGDLPLCREQWEQQVQPQQNEETHP